LGKLKFDSDEIDVDELSELCEGLSGADVKSIVGDALVKAFHRVTKEDNSFFLATGHVHDNSKQSNDFINSIKVEKDDLLTSINSIKQTINFNERKKLKLM